MLLWQNNWHKYRLNSYETHNSPPIKCFQTLHTNVNSRHWGPYSSTLQRIPWKACCSSPSALGDYFWESRRALSLGGGPSLGVLPWQVQWQWCQGTRYRPASGIEHPNVTHLYKSETNNNLIKRPVSSSRTTGQNWCDTKTLNYI